MNLSEMTMSIKFEIDGKSLNFSQYQINKSFVKMSQYLSKQITKAVSKGLQGGIKEGVQKGSADVKGKGLLSNLFGVSGRFGFAGGGFGVLSPFMPKVVGAYIAGRYMHMFVNALLNPMEKFLTDLMKSYSTRVKEKVGTPMEELVESIQNVQNILPTMGTKSAFFLSELTKGTTVTPDAIAQDLKNMMIAGKASSPEQALRAYTSALEMPDTARDKILYDLTNGQYSSNTAQELKYANAKNNLFSVMSPEKIDNFVMYLSSLINNAKEVEQKTLENLSDRFKVEELITKSTHDLIDDSQKKLTEEQGKNKKLIDKALSEPRESSWIARYQGTYGIAPYPIDRSPWLTEEKRNQALYGTSMSSVSEENTSMPPPPSMVLAETSKSPPAGPAKTPPAVISIIATMAQAVENINPDLFMKLIWVLY